MKLLVCYPGPLQVVATYRNHFSVVHLSIRHKSCSDNSSETTGGILSKFYRNDQYLVLYVVHIISNFQFNDFWQSYFPLKILKFFWSTPPKLLMQFEWNFTGLAQVLAHMLQTFWLNDFWLSYCPLKKKCFSCSFLQK